MQVNCRTVPELASGWIDRDAPVTLLARLALHLMICSSCSRYVRSLRTTARLAAASFPPDLPHDLPPGLADRLAAAGARRNGAGRQP